MLAVTNRWRFDMSPSATAKRDRAYRHDSQPFHTVSVRIFCRVGGVHGSRSSSSQPSWSDWRTHPCRHPRQDGSLAWHA
jgi:hypothetical protein